MKEIKMNNKNIIEYLISLLTVFILEGIIGIGLILGFFWCIGMLELFMENHAWAFVMVTIGAIISVFKMVTDSE